MFIPAPMPPAGRDILVVEDDQVIIILQQYEGDDSTTKEIEELRLGIVVLYQTLPPFGSKSNRFICTVHTYSTEKER